MASFNKVVLVGNLTRDPELRTVGSGSAVCELGLAINRTYKVQGEKREEVTFVDVTCWGKTAEIAEQYLAKGRQILIEGRLTLSEWEDKDGNKRSKLRVTCENLTMLGSRPDGVRPKQNDSSQQQPQWSDAAKDEDTPF